MKPLKLTGGGRGAEPAAPDFGVIPCTSARTCRAHLGGAGSRPAVGLVSLPYFMSLDLHHGDGLRGQTLQPTSPYHPLLPAWLQESSLLHRKGGGGGGGPGGGHPAEGKAAVSPLVTGRICTTDSVQASLAPMPTLYSQCYMSPFFTCRNLRPFATKSPAHQRPVQARPLLRVNAALPASTVSATGWAPLLPGGSPWIGCSPVG